MKILAPVFVFIVPYLAYLSAELFGMSAILAFVLLSVNPQKQSEFPHQNRRMRHHDEAVREGQPLARCQPISEVFRQNVGPMQ